MNVALSKYYQEFIRERIQTGRYGNASEVVRAGLRALEQAEQQPVLAVRDLDRKLAEGLASPASPLTPGDFETIRTRTRKKLAKLEAA